MIVGGTPAPDGKYPWQVRIYGSMNDTIGFCGGSIIGEQWVLTAAHCLMDTQAVVVGFGSVDRTKTTKIESEKIIVHPAYLAGEKADIALIKLKSPIPNAPVDRHYRPRQGTGACSRRAPRRPSPAGARSGTCRPSTTRST